MVVSDHVISLTTEDFQGGSYVVLEVEGETYREPLNTTFTRARIVATFAIRLAEPMCVVLLGEVLLNAAKIVSYREINEGAAPVLIVTMTNGKNWLFNGEEVDTYTARVKEAIAFR